MIHDDPEIWRHAKAARIAFVEGGPKKVRLAGYEADDVSPWARLDATLADAIRAYTEQSAGKEWPTIRRIMPVDIYNTLARYQTSNRLTWVYADDMARDISSLATEAATGPDLEVAGNEHIKGMIAQLQAELDRRGSAKSTPPEAFRSDAVRTQHPSEDEALQRGELEPCSLPHDGTATADAEISAKVPKFHVGVMGSEALRRAIEIAEDGMSHVGVALQYNNDDAAREWLDNADKEIADLRSALASAEVEG